MHVRQCVATSAHAVQQLNHNIKKKETSIIKLTLKLIYFISLKENKFYTNIKYLIKSIDNNIVIIPIYDLLAFKPFVFALIPKKIVAKIKNNDNIKKGKGFPLWEIPFPINKKIKSKENKEKTTLNIAYKLPKLEPFEK